jgi:hypothetical protein
MCSRARRQENTALGSQSERGAEETGDSARHGDGAWLTSKAGTRRHSDRGSDGGGTRLGHAPFGPRCWDEAFMPARVTERCYPTRPIRARRVAA